LADNVYTFGTTARPKIKFDGGEEFVLPYPNGLNKDGIKIYDFEDNLLDSFRSEGNKQIDVGKRFIFVANLNWLTSGKQVLHKFFKAHAEASFLYYINEDVDLKYRVKVANLKFKGFIGLNDSIGGYNIQLQLRGMEYVDKPDLGALNIGEGYGSGYGQQYGTGL